MTAQELIKQLQQIAPNTTIVVRGYEDGYNDILKLKSIKIKQARNIHWYYGEFEDSKDDDAITAIELYGENKISVERF